VAKANLGNAKELYPSCGMGLNDWLSFFNTPPGLQAFGRILYDIYDEVKSQEEREAGIRRIGRRPARAAVPVDEVLGIIFPQEFSNEPMRTSLPKLMGKRSQRAFAAKVPMSQTHLSRILSGHREAGTELSIETIEGIARAAGVTPWFFPEWRAHYLGELVTQVLMESPHLAITVLKNLRTDRQRTDGTAS